MKAHEMFRQQGTCVVDASGGWELDGLVLVGYRYCRCFSNVDHRASFEVLRRGKVNCTHWQCSTGLQCASSAACPNARMHRPASCTQLRWHQYNRRPNPPRLHRPRPPIPQRCTIESLLLFHYQSHCSTPSMYALEQSEQQLSPT